LSDFPPLVGFSFEISARKPSRHIFYCSLSNRIEESSNSMRTERQKVDKKGAGISNNT
jgi:hypothetical protein